jgi:hypothetical protein
MGMLKGQGGDVDIREELAKRVTEGAAWRDKGNTEGENRRSVDALRELATHAMTLAPGDRRLQAIAELEFGKGTFPDSGNDIDRLIAGYGGNRRMQPHPDTFLRDLVGIADQRAQLRRLGHRNSAKRSVPARQALRLVAGTPNGAAPSTQRMPEPAEERYGMPTQWDFRPPHPLGPDSNIIEMPFDQVTSVT